MADNAQDGNVSIPVTNMDDENGHAFVAPSIHVENGQYFNSPTANGGSMLGDDGQVSNINQAYSPAIQLESSLNESAIDSFVQHDNVKVPMLESTRISMTSYPPPDFEFETEISKVSQSDVGDSDNAFNAGFLRSRSSEADPAPHGASKEAEPESSLETSVFESGRQVSLVMQQYIANILS